MASFALVVSGLPHLLNYIIHYPQLLVNNVIICTYGQVLYFFVWGAFMFALAEVIGEVKRLDGLTVAGRFGFSALDIATHGSCCSAFIASCNFFLFWG